MNLGILLLQSILTWALLAGMLVLGFHTALQVNAEFREWVEEKIKPFVNKEMYLWGAQMGQKYGPLFFTWVYVFFLPILIPFGQVIVRLALMYDTTHSIKKVGRVKMPSNEVIEKIHAEAMARRDAILMGVARVAYEATRVSETFDDAPDPGCWDDLPHEMHVAGLTRVKAVLNDPETYLDHLGEITDLQMDGEIVFHHTTIACADALNDLGVCVWPVKVVDHGPIAQDEVHQ